MPRRPLHPPVDHDKEIRRLQDALYRARMDIINLMPEVKRRLLEGWIFCGSARDADNWERWAVGGLIELAESRPGREMGDVPWARRAYCPLCGDGAQTSGYQQGFSVPVGLERHLRGSHRSMRCSVFRAAAELCWEQVRERQRGEPQLASAGNRLVRPWERQPVKAAAPAAPSTSAVVIKLRGG